MWLWLPGFIPGAAGTVSGVPRRTPSEGSEVPGYRPEDHPPFAVTVDLVVITMSAGRPSLVLIRRGTPPFLHRWALPGGFKHPDESLGEAARRELREETGLNVRRGLWQFHAYGNPERDPRMNVVTVVYLALLPEITSLDAGTDASLAALHPLDSVLAGDLELAFDHQSILTDAVSHLARRLETEPFVTHLLPERFTLGELRRLYEWFWNESIDPANFRRSLLEGPEPYVEATGERSRSGARGGRPPELFTATTAWIHGPAPIRRSRRRQSSSNPSSFMGSEYS